MSNVSHLQFGGGSRVISASSFWILFADVVRALEALGVALASFLEPRSLELAVAIIKELLLFWGGQNKEGTRKCWQESFEVFSPLQRGKVGVLGGYGDVLPLGDQDGGGPGGGQRAASDGARGAGQQQWGIKEAESAGRKGRQIRKQKLAGF